MMARFCAYVEKVFALGSSMATSFFASRKRCCAQCQKRTLTIQDKEVVEYYQRRQRIAGQWQETEETASWYWATTFSPRQLPTRAFWRAAHRRWDIENDCFNTLSTHWGLDHCYNHDATAITNFTLTLFIVFVLLQSFWRRNLKPAKRVLLTLIALARELDRGLAGCRAPWHRQLARGP